MFHDAERVIADPVVRNRGTIGGSLGQADPAEDLTTVVRRPAGRGRHPPARRRADRRHPTSSTAGPYETACEQHEILTEIRFPIGPRPASAYEKVERRVGDWAVGAAGAALVLADDGTIADATHRPHRPRAEGLAAEAAEALRGSGPSDDLFADAGRLAARGQLADRGPARSSRLQAPPGRRAHPPGPAPRRGAPVPAASGG